MQPIRLLNNRFQHFIYSTNFPSLSIKVRVSSNSGIVDWEEFADRQNRHISRTVKAPKKEKGNKPEWSPKSNPRLGVVGSGFQIIKTYGIIFICSGKRCKWLNKNPVYKLINFYFFKLSENFPCKQSIKKSSIYQKDICALTNIILY